MFLRSLILFVFLRKCSGVIYDLNDTEYERMPPLTAVEAYESCLRAERGTYCVATLELFAEPQNELMNIIHEYSEHTPKHYNHTRIERGVCLTKSCKKYIEDKNLDRREDQAEILEACVNETMYNEYGLQSKLSILYYCDKHKETIQADASDWFVAVLLLGLLVMNVAGSYYHIQISKAIKGENNWKGNKYLLSFSIFENWASLLADEPRDKTFQKFKGLHGIKTSAIILMVLGHVMLVVGSPFTDNSHEFEKAHDQIHYRTIFNGMIITQVFFVMSGFLTAYNLLAAEESRVFKWNMLPKILFYRWWRLTPSNMLVIAILATWIRHLGSGPLWNYFITITTHSDCRKHWYKHLLFLNNYEPEDHFCQVQSWHIASDYQMFIIGVIIFFATKGRARNLVVVLMMILGLIFPALHVWWNDMDGILLMEPEFYRTINSDNFFYLHVYGHNNITGFATGMFIASLIKNWQKRGVDFSKNKVTRYAFQLTFPAIVLLFYSGGIFYHGDRGSLAFRMAYIMVQRISINVIGAFLVMGCVMRFDDSFRSILEWRGWLVPSRLSYSVYLLHFTIINVILGTRTQLGHMSFFHVLINHFGVVTMSFLLSLPLYVMVEAPLNKLMKSIMTAEPGDLQLQKKEH